MRKLTEEEWAKLVKVWQEEGLSHKALSDRFGASTTKIQLYLMEKFGTARSPKWRAHIWR